jgi:hypothetical protein
MSKQRRVVVTQYDGLYYRLEFEQSDGLLWHKEQANVIAHENKMSVWVGNWIQCGKVSDKIFPALVDYGTAVRGYNQ